MKTKIIGTYAQALLLTTISTNSYFSIISDILLINNLLNNTKILRELFNNPFIDSKTKIRIIKKSLNSQITILTMNFLLILINQNRIQYLENIFICYKEILYERIKILPFEIISYNKFTDEQKQDLITKLKLITNSIKIELVFQIDPNLIGGFLIKNNSLQMDLTLKNQIKKLNSYLIS
jgi:F-type H+-transporting ATPase subunit delta